MKNKLFPILICLLIAGQLPAQKASYSFPFESDEFQQLGVYQQHLFFSNRRSDESTDRLWQFNTEAEEFIELSSDATYLIDFQLTPEGVFWMVKERINRFNAGRLELWFWSGGSDQAPELLQTTVADRAQFLAHSETHLFLSFDIQVVTVNLNTSRVRNLGVAPIPLNPTQADFGTIWQGRYYWSVSDGASEHQIYWADPGLGLQLFWHAEERVYNIIPLGDRLVWREGTRLVRFDWDSPGPQYYYQFEDWDTRISFLGEWFGASLNDSLYIFPGATERFGSEIWRTDGTQAGTYQLRDIATERTANFVPGSFPQYLHQRGGEMHFLAAALPGEYQHWTTDGTTEGTILQTQNLAADDRIYFGNEVNDSTFVIYVQSSLNGMEPLIFSGGLRFYDIHTGPANSLGSIFPSKWLGLSDGSLVMEAFTAESGLEPWILFPDQGQAQLADIAARQAWSMGPILGEVDGMVYLIGGNIDQGYQLYQLDPNEEADFPPSTSTLRWQQNIHPAIVPTASSGWVYSMGLARGTDGSLYSSGSTNINAGQLTFNRGEPAVHKQDLFADAYVTRMDGQGIAEWFLPLPGSFVGSDAPLIAEAPEGGVYAGGRFFRSSQVGETPVEKSAGDAYLAKIQSDGVEEWVKTFSLSGGEIFRLRTDSLGYLWAIGNYRNQANIDGIALTSALSPAYFVARWSPAGELQWARTLEPGINWPSWGPVHAANIDADGNLWMVLNNMGHNYNAPCDFGTLYARLVKLSPGGTILAEQEWSGNDAWYTTDLNFTAQGNVLMVGRFRGNLELGNFPLQYRTSECASTGFVAKLDPFGNVVQAKRMDNGHIPEAVVANQDGTYTLAGYQELLERVSYPGFTHFPFGRKQGRIFTAVYSGTDSLLVERTFLANETFRDGGFIFLLPGSEDEWIIQGELEGMLDTIGTVPTSFGTRHHVYLMSLDLPYELPQGEADQKLVEEEIQVFPNPSSDFVLLQTEDMDFDQADIALYNAQGQRLGQVLQRFEPQLYRINVSNLPVGIYQLVVQLGDQVISKPIYKSD